MFYLLSLSVRYILLCVVTKVQLSSISRTRELYYVDDRYGEWSGEKTGRTEPWNWNVNTSVRCLEETAM